MRRQKFTDEQWIILEGQALNAEPAAMVAKKNCGTAGWTMLNERCHMIGASIPSS
jgi:hypothetical protein